MTHLHRPRCSYRRTRLPVTCMLLVMAAGCATTPEAPAPTSRIEIQEDIGFTIIEEARAGGDVRVNYAEALRLLEQGSHERGIAVLEGVVADAPTLTAPRIDLGIANHRAGNLGAAEENLVTALELAPDHPIVHNELGIIYRKTGRFGEARQSYERALAIFPGYHFARRNLAVLCDLYLGDLECALENYESYMTTVPADDEARIWIADIRMRLNEPEAP